MKLNALIAECTAYDFKIMLEEKKPKSWLKSISAFANGLGGSLFFGIENDGIVKGLDNVQHVCETISSKIRDYMDPLPEVEIIPHDIDDLHILQLKVHAGHYTPYYYVGDGQRIAFVRVGDESIPATAEQMVGEHDGDMSETKLTERQQKILNLIKKDPTITGKQMSETLSVSQRTVERDLSVLKEKGVLVREGKDNDGIWIISLGANTRRQ